MTEVAERKAVDLAGKYLTFKLADEVYGLEILKVREIIGLLPITSLPRTPVFVRGVINLRGKVIPVIDLRQKFELDVTDDTDQTCTIVVDVQGSTGGTIQVGIIVDSVSEVLDILGEEIEDAPAFGSSVDTAFILGMAKAKGSVKILLNIEKVLSPSDLGGINLRQSDRRQKAEAADEERRQGDRRGDDD
ncbi:MAG: chemotaxis protein CheW [Chitinispirillales bacterium]|jgi:purine-binding chemotaxis protein CheW|nr:chemotaxis protein CheW [Chitinispirillales bacterium]